MCGCDFPLATALNGVPPSDFDWRFQAQGPALAPRSLDSSAQVAPLALRGVRRDACIIPVTKTAALPIEAHGASFRRIRVKGGVHRKRGAVVFITPCACQSVDVLAGPIALAGPPLFDNPIPGARALLVGRATGPIGTHPWLREAIRANLPAVGDAVAFFIIARAGHMDSVTISRRGAWASTFVSPKNRTKAEPSTRETNAH
jgi:hypothetical protein